MKVKDQVKQNPSDPLGLGELQAIEPDYDGWGEIESALLNHKGKKQRVSGWLAIAASLVLVLGLTLHNTEESGTGIEGENEFNLADVATSGLNVASVSVQDNIDALIGLSQSMEDQVKQLRQKTSSMPAESTIYVAELEDLIAQVDNELSFTPGSIDLWGQRVNLLLDLAQIYQQQWQIDYGRMAAL